MSVTQSQYSTLLVLVTMCAASMISDDLPNSTRTYATRQSELNDFSGITVATLVSIPQFSDNSSQQNVRTTSETSLTNLSRTHKRKKNSSYRIRRFNEKVNRLSLTLRDGKKKIANMTRLAEYIRNNVAIVECLSWFFLASKVAKMILEEVF